MIRTKVCRVCGFTVTKKGRLIKCETCGRRLCPACVAPAHLSPVPKCRNFEKCADVVLEVAEGKPYSLSFRLEGLPSGQTSSGRNKYAIAKERKAWHRAVWFTVRLRRPHVPLLIARAEFTRHSSVEIDPTNLAWSFKAIEDALVIMGVIEDDRGGNYTDGKPNFRWQKAPPGRGFVTVTIEEGKIENGEEENTRYHLDGSG